jgi:ketol-acid reductoisomerase
VAVIYGEKDASLDILRGKKIAVIGYGSQGSAQAQNLRDSDLEVAVAELPDSPAWKRAQEDGFHPLPTDKAASWAQILLILVPDHLHAQIFGEQILPGLSSGNAMIFAHGFSVCYRQVIPPHGVDCLMVAPKGPGGLVRNLYRRGLGVICLLAIFQDATGHSKEIGLAVAKGIGGTRAGVIETDFIEETETDLFGEQAVLCGGLTALIKAGFETLLEAGYQPEIAYFECLHEIKQIADMIYVRGIQGMRDRISDTARYGDVTRGPKVISPQIKKDMAELLESIRDGSFSQEWLAENRAGRPNFSKLLSQDDDHPIELVGKKLRSLMPWLEQV